MKISDILAPQSVVCSSEATSKKAVLELAANLVSETSKNLAGSEVFDSFCARERLGSTGLGRGVAIPHGRLEHTFNSYGVFISLTEGVDFDAIDSQHVDLIFALIVPQESTEEHLNILAQLAEMFSDDDFLTLLRRSNTPEELYAYLIDWQPAT